MDFDKGTRKTVQKVSYDVYVMGCLIIEAPLIGAATPRVNEDFTLCILHFLFMLGAIIFPMYAILRWKKYN